MNIKQFGENLVVSILLAVVFTAIIFSNYNRTVINSDLSEVTLPEISQYEYCHVSELGEETFSSYEPVPEMSQYTYDQVEETFSSYEPTPEVEDDTKIALCESDYDCLLLAEVGYFEGRSEPDNGVLAIMGSVTERAADPRFPEDTIHSVVHRKGSYTYLWDGSKGKYSEPDQHKRMKVIAFDLLNGIRVPPFNATHYHTVNIKPWWSKTDALVYLGTIKNHKFYNGF